MQASFLLLEGQGISHVPPPNFWPECQLLLAMSVRGLDSHSACILGTLLGGTHPCLTTIPPFGLRLKWSLDKSEGMYLKGQWAGIGAVMESGGGPSEA
jgi:hypothetical protein